MINNNAFILTEEELRRYNKWATEIATAMGNADIESWSVNVTFNFSNYGTAIVAHSGCGTDRSGDLIIRDETDW